MVLYFTGTDNSKHIAEVIAKTLGDTVLDCTKLIKSGEYPSFNSEKPYVFVSPIYAWRMPRVFQKWISLCSFVGNKKAYFVFSCGDSIGAASNYVKSFANKNGFEYMGTAQVVMPENYVVMFNPTPKEEDDAIISNAHALTEILCDKIASEKAFDKIKATFVGRLCSDIVTPFFYAFYIGAKKFYATDECVSCGLCSDVCMLNNVNIKDGKPVWGKICTHCMACICKCPTEAIEYGKNTVGRRRYVFPKNK